MHPRNPGGPRGIALVSGRLHLTQPLRRDGDGPECGRDHAHVRVPLGATPRARASWSPLDTGVTSYDPLDGPPARDRATQAARAVRFGSPSFASAWAT